MKKLAVVILNWNGRKLLERYLPSAASYSADADCDVIVADNGSEDDSCEYVQRNYPDVRLLRLDSNYGFAGGYNRAIKRLNEIDDYEYVLLLNSDVEVTPGWWQPLVRFMDANPDVGAVQPKIRSLRQPEMFEYAGAAGGYLDRLWYPYCRGRLFDSVERDNGQYDDKSADICWASGAALLIRRDLYLQLGGLDEKFFAHMEEIDLCCRIHAAGSRVCCVPDSTVYHYGGASLSQGSPQKTYLNFRNNLLLMHKNMPRKRGARKIFVRMLTDALAFLMFAVKGDFANARSIVKAHSDFRKMKKNYTSFPDKDIVATLPGSNRNILIDRYLLQKKK